MACWHVLTVVLVAFAITELEAVREVEGISDELGEPSPSTEESDFYNTIPGFAMTAGSSKHTAKTVEACKAKCSADANCKSASWNSATDAPDRCLTSAKTLSYDPEFTLYVQAKATPKEGTYRLFPGMVYKTGSPITGATLSACEVGCNDDTACQAFSFTPGKSPLISKCFHSGQVISYSPTWSYFEKKGLDLLAAAEAESEDSPEAATAQEAVTEDPAVQAMERKEKVKQAEAKAAKAEAAKRIAAYATQMAAHKSEASSKIAEFNAEAEKKVKDTATEITETVASKMAAFDKQKAIDFKMRNETLQLEFADRELKTKAEERAGALGEKRRNAAAFAAEAKELSQKAAFGGMDIHEKQAHILKETAVADADNVTLVTKTAACASNTQEFETGTTHENCKSVMGGKISDTTAAGLTDVARIKEETQATVGRIRRGENEDGTAEEGTLAEIQQKLAENKRQVEEQEQKLGDERIAEFERNNQQGNSAAAALAKQALDAASAREQQDAAAVDEANAETLKAKAEDAAAGAAASREQAMTQMALASKSNEASSKLEEIKTNSGLLTVELAEKDAQKLADTKENGEKKKRADASATAAAIAEKEKQAAARAQKHADEASKQAVIVTNLAKSAAERSAELLAQNKKTANDVYNSKIQEAADLRDKNTAFILDAQRQQVADAVAAKTSAETEAAVMTSGADAAAEVAAAKARAAAATHISDSADLAAKREGFVTVDVASNMAAYVDSGNNKGLKLAELHRQVIEATEEVVKAKANDVDAQRQVQDAIAVHAEAIQNSAPDNPEEEEDAQAAPTPAPAPAAARRLLTAAARRLLTEAPTAAPAATEAPTAAPAATEAPTAAPAATEAPTAAPAATDAPTNAPTAATDAPTNAPTAATEAPTKAPTTAAPTTAAPTKTPTTAAPTKAPTQVPTQVPTKAPTRTPTANPTREPTPPPTLSAAAVKEIDEKAAVAAEAVAKKAAADAAAAAEAAINAETEKEAKVKSDEAAALEEQRKRADEKGNKDILAGYITTAKAEQAKMDAIVSAKETALQITEAAVAQAKTETSNKAFGDTTGSQCAQENKELCPDMILDVQTGPVQKKMAFMKFPVQSLLPEWVVTGATLELFQYGGAAGEIMVKKASCSWTRDTITYTNSQDFAGVELNTDAPQFAPVPADATGPQKIMVNLNAEEVQKARLAGSSICIRISGGASSAADLITSEFSANPPSMKLTIAKPLAEIVAPPEMGEALKAEESAASKALARRQAKATIQAAVEKELHAVNAKHLEALDATAMSACTADAKEVSSGAAHAAAWGEIKLSYDTEMAGKVHAKKLELEGTKQGKAAAAAALMEYTKTLTAETAGQKKAAMKVKMDAATKSVWDNCKNEKKVRHNKWSNLTPAQEKTLKETVDTRLQGQSVQKAMDSKQAKQGAEQALVKKEAKLVEKGGTSVKKSPNLREGQGPVATMDGDALLTL